MDCGICGKSVRQQKEGLCFRCYVISHAIRLEPEIPHSMTLIDSRRAITNHKHSPFSLSPFISDVNVKVDNTQR